MYSRFFYSFLFFSIFSFNFSDAQSIEIWETKTDKSVLFSRKDAKIQFENVENDSPCIFIDESKKFQAMEGFGYTLTGGSAQLLWNLKNRREVLNELFNDENNNIGVSYLRISIGASDLDAHVFSYSQKENNFSLKEDEKFLIPVLKEILSINPKIKIMGSPWSPPIWMKTNNSSMGGSLKKEHYQDYAQYLARYISEMKKHGINIDAITIQNEPLHPGNNPSLLMYASEQASFIKNHLGPLFKYQKIKTKILIYDHNADRQDYPISILNDPLARQYIAGSAFHLYGGSVENIRDVHDLHPDKDLYFTEQWIGHPSNFEGDFNWHVKNLIIGATRNWCKTVLEWNLASDPELKIHTEGGCTACLGAITIDNQEVNRNAAYYIIAHASKFVRPGSYRIASNQTLGLSNVAFIRPDGKKVLIIMNESDKPSEFYIANKSKKAMISIPAGSTYTLVW